MLCVVPRGHSAEWGAGIGALFVGMFGGWSCNIPYAIGTGDYGIVIFTGVLLLPFPLLVAVWPAGVSSRCNALLASSLC